MRRIPGLVAAALLAASSSALADVSLEGGFCLPPRLGEAWVEVWAEIENRDAFEFRGTLDAELPGYRSGGPKSSREVSIAPGAKKRFFLVLSTAFASRSDLELRVRERGKGDGVRKKIGATLPPGTDRTLVLVSRPDSPAALIASLPERKLTGAYYRWEADVARLPEHLEGWSTAGLVVISGADMGLWSEEQRHSLRAWVEQGGQALLLPGTDPKWLESAGVRSLVNVGRVSEQDVDVWPSPWFGTSGPRAVLSFSNDGQRLLPKTGNIAKVWRVGTGRVAVVAFDTGVPSLASSDGLQRFATDLLYQLPAAPSAWRDYAYSRGTYEWAKFTEALGQDLVTYPATLWILLVLFAYIAVVGPVNFWLLRRRHSPAWAVLTVPATGIMVTGVLIGAGWIARDARVSVNRITVLRPEGDEWASAREHLVLVAGKRRETLVSSALGRLAELTDGSRLPRREVSYGGEAGDAIARPLEPNEPAYFFAIGRRRLGTLAARIDGDDLVVLNGTGSDIEHAWYHDERGRWLDLGALPDGKEFRGLSDPSDPRTPRIGVEDDPASVVVQSLDPLFVKAREAVVVAFLKSASAPPVVDGEAKRLKRDVTVLISPVKEDLK